MNAERVLKVSVALWPEHGRVAIPGAQFGHIISNGVEITGNRERSAIDVKLDADVIDFDV